MISYVPFPDEINEVPERYRVVSCLLRSSVQWPKFSDDSAGTPHQTPYCTPIGHGIRGTVLALKLAQSFAKLRPQDFLSLEDQECQCVTRNGRPRRVS
jgi:hypothetical protein